MCYKQKCKVVSLNLAHPVEKKAYEDGYLNSYNIWKQENEQTIIYSIFVTFRTHGPPISLLLSFTKLRDLDREGTMVTFLAENCSTS